MCVTFAYDVVGTLVVDDLSINREISANLALVIR